MGYLIFYVTDSDLPQIQQAILEDPSLHFIERTDFGWQPTRSIESLAQRRYSLWHLDSGRLPVFMDGKKIYIEEPLSGWQESQDDKRDTPYFGPGWPGIFSLQIRCNALPRAREVMWDSSFQWIGNHYAALGFVAPPHVRKSWEKLTRRVRKLCSKVFRERLHYYLMPGAAAIYSENTQM